MFRLEKPDNQFCICDDEISDFIRNVSVKSIPGIGRVNYKKCKDLKKEVCSDMYDLTIDQLVQLFVHMVTLYLIL